MVTKLVVKLLREEIVDLFSEITASIDFVDDEEFSLKKIIKNTKKFFDKCNNILQKQRILRKKEYLQNYVYRTS